MFDVRPSPIAGQWYPGNPAQLSATVDGYLQEAVAPTVPGGPVAVVAPHAGHRYSGAVAAHAFKIIQGRDLELIIILCPSHFHDDAPLLTSGHDAYATPLGETPVDREAVDRLRAELAAALHSPESETLVAIKRDREHAIEIELPFLQRALPKGFALVPIMLRDQTRRVTHALGLALANVLKSAGRRAFIVGSSDLSHFYSQAVARQLDAEMLRQIEAFDPDGVLKAEAAGRGFACGHGAIAATLWAARELGATNARVLKHATSGDVTHDYDSVVGYGAAVIWKDVEPTTSNQQRHTDES
ncbi:MAG: AmmeMemoRadiSam system protein B [Chloroflexi bacterium]|nr:AmmeMemoRadiSam system protein B [Chloroflexota bacterium]